MAMGGASKAGRKKVRCPKCTALFPEPAIAVFKCPICACQLSGWHKAANGATLLMEDRSLQTKEEDSGRGKAVLATDAPTKMQGSMDVLLEENISRHGNGMKQEEKSIEQEQELDSVVSHPQMCKQQPITECPQVFEKDDSEGQPSSTEGLHGKEGIPGPFSPMLAVSKSVNLANGKQREESPPQLFAGAEEEGALVGTTGQHFRDDASKENSLTVSKENNLITAVDEEVEAQDCMVNGVSRNHHLQSEIFRTTRCEFSFKYSVGGASRLQSDGDLIHRKRFPSAKTGSLEATLPNTEASDVPLHTPLRVRISKSLDESSDQSENERGLFGSETDSDDTSGSDFGFPAPWTEGLQDILLPVPFSQNEGFHPNSKTDVSAAPHQLELQDAYDTIDHEELSLQQESGKHFKAPDPDLSSQVENDDEIIKRESEFRDEGSCGGLLQPVLPKERSQGSLESPGRAEITFSDVKSLPNNAQSLDVNNLGRQVSSIENLGMPGNNEALFMEGSRQKLSWFASEECSEGGEEQDAGLKVKCQPEESGNMDHNIQVHQEASKLFGVVVTSDGRQVLDMNNYSYVKQESISAEKEDIVASLSVRNADFTTSATSPNLEYLPSNLDHIDCGDATHNISNAGGFQMADSRESYEKRSFYNNQMIEGLSSSMSKIMQSNNEANDRDGRTANRNTSSLMEKPELEQDLYALPHETYGNDLVTGESSHSALWVEEENAVSDGRFVSTSRAKLNQEKKSTLKSLHGTIHGKLGSQAIRSNNGDDFFVSGEEINLRGRAALQEGSLQATAEHVGWEGRITAAEDQSGHVDLHAMEGKPGSYSHYPVNNSNSFPLANPQPYAFNNHQYGYGASGTNQIYPYPLPAQNLVHPVAFQNHALSHCGYQPVSPACMLCSYHYTHMQPQHAHRCGSCFSQSGSVGYNSGLVEHWNCHQGSLGPPSSCAGSLADYPQACSSTTRIQKHDFTNAESRSRASLAGKYPPLPKHGAAPYFTCKGCSRLLQVPSNLPPVDGTIQKLRCSACGKVTKLSVGYYDRVSVSSTHSPDLDSMVGAANMLLQYGTHSRQPLVRSAIEDMKSPYKHDMVKMNPVQHGLNELSPQAHSTATSQSFEQNSQAGGIFRGQARGRAMDASRNTYGQHDPSISVSSTGPAHLQNASSMVGVMSPRNAILRPTDSVGFGRAKVNTVATVDEEEEGLDFGAPRISDGDSLDHSESRMRSPDYDQASYETAHVDISQGAPSRGHQPLKQVSDLNECHDTAAQEKRPGSPLLALLNQESTRFRLNLEPRLPFEGSNSAMWSPASDATVYAKSVNDRLRNREQVNSRSPGSPGQHFVRKGPRYIAGLLRRSLRDFGKGGQ